jgi:hypothetical protein
MALEMFRSLSSLHMLDKNLEANLDAYRSGDFGSILKNQKLLTVQADFFTGIFDNLICSNKAADDYQNSILLWNSLKITPRLAREARLWCYLTHTCGLAYARARYPLVNGDAADIKSVRAHFLVNNELRGIDRDNALSRLWISAFIASKVEGLKFEVALEVLLYQTDFREQLIGHPTIMRSAKTLNEVMCFAKKMLIDDGNTDFFKRKDHKGQYKTWFHLLDVEGGKVLLDALSKQEISKLVQKLAEQAR